MSSVRLVCCSLQIIKYEPTKRRDLGRKEKFVLCTIGNVPYNPVTGKHHDEIPHNLLLNY
jgi:hypothetical protein